MRSYGSMAQARAASPSGTISSSPDPRPRLQHARRREIAHAPNTVHEEVRHMVTYRGLGSSRPRNHGMTCVSAAEILGTGASEARVEVAETTCRRSRSQRPTRQLPQPPTGLPDRAAIRVPFLQPDWRCARRRRLFGLGREAGWRRRKTGWTGRRCAALPCRPKITWCGRTERR